MDKFYETKHQIFDLSMEDRLKFCQKNGFRNDW